MAQADDRRTLLKESFAEDMARHQRLQGKLPTPEENRQLVTPEFEKLEQKMQDEWSRFRSKSKPRKDPRSSDPVEKKAKDAGWSYFRAPETSGQPKPVRYTMDDLRARERIALLTLEKNSGPRRGLTWSKCVRAMVARYYEDKARGVPYSRNRGAALLEWILEESSKFSYFGDWRNPPNKEPKALIF